MPSNVVRASAVDIYLCRLHSGVSNFFYHLTDNGTFLQSDIQSCVATIRNNTLLYTSRKKISWTLTIRHIITDFSAQILTWKNVWKKNRLRRVKTAHKKRKRMSQEKNNDRHKFVRILSYMLTRFLHGLLEIQRVSGDIRIRHCLHV